MSYETKYQKAIQSITAKLESTRKANNLTQKDVAFKSEMEEQNYRRIEQGETNPTLKSLTKICTALDIELKDLF